MRGATRGAAPAKGPESISTHAPLAGRDRHARTAIWTAKNFNPRAPCGARLLVIQPRRSLSQFQPTRPLRGATGVDGGAGATGGFQPTRPLRGATGVWRTTPASNTFQPTRPLRGATWLDSVTVLQRHISTHAPLAGRDVADQAASGKWEVFQPTRPLRGATYGEVFAALTVVISTHAPLAGRDQPALTVFCPQKDFNPRAPCGARQLHAFTAYKAYHFNPRAPCGARRALVMS